jgi:hypothetical protein
MIHVDPPFDLGETLQGTDDDGNLINTSWLGQIFEIPSSTIPQFAAGNRARRSGRPVVAVILRNESGQALLPKHVVNLTDTAGYSLLESADGYADALAQDHVAIVDEHLPSAGVADDDIFWGILKGPVTVLTPQEAGSQFNGDIAVGGHLVASTASTTLTANAGRVSNVTVVGQTGGTQAFSMARNILGFALSAKTTGNTDADLLICATIQY